MYCHLPSHTDRSLHPLPMRYVPADWLTANRTKRTMTSTAPSNSWRGSAPIKRNRSAPNRAHHVQQTHPQLHHLSLSVSPQLRAPTALVRLSGAILSALPTTVLRSDCAPPPVWERWMEGSKFSITLGGKHSSHHGYISISKRSTHIVRSNAIEIDATSAMGSASCLLHSHTHTWTPWSRPARGRSKLRPLL